MYQNFALQIFADSLMRETGYNELCVYKWRVNIELVSCAA